MLASEGQRNAAANHVESITVPGKRRGSGHRGRGFWHDGELTAPNCTPLQTNLRGYARASSHSMKGFCKSRASCARTGVMRRGNLYHNTI
ncbi:UNVERIFIED_ORG: hypothetical protein ABIC48_001787 [Burkholderia territorii]